MCALFVLPLAPLAADGQDEILLWPKGAPGSEGKTIPEAVRITPEGDHVVSHVHKPSIRPYLPARDKATGAAVIVAPGGGHSELWIDHEGYNVAQWLSDHGVAAFVLKYRLAKETNSTYTVDGDELADMQRAIRLVRSRAGDWGIDPHRLGVMGFSAGGELAFLAAMRYDNGGTNSADPVDLQSSKPDFQGLIYPGNSRRIEPTTNSPPVFLACGYNDRADISQGLAAVYLKFKQVNLPTELHIYTGVGHGFGLRSTTTGPVSKWIDRYYEWLGERGFLKVRAQIAGDPVQGGAADVPLPVSPIIAASTLTLSDYMSRTNHRMIWVTRPLARKLDPTNSTDSHFDWWPSRNTNEWIEAAFARPETISETQVYWFDDSQKRGGCSTPVSWRAFYKDADQWKPVATTNEYAVTKNQYDKVAFKPVTTTGLRLEIQLKPDWSGGIESWKVK